MLYTPDFSQIEVDNRRKLVFKRPFDFLDDLREVLSMLEIRSPTSIWISSADWQYECGLIGFT